jgi:hypothetical protein
MAWLNGLGRTSRPARIKRFATIHANVAAPIFPLGLSRHTWLVGGVSGAGLGDHERIHASCLASVRLLAGIEGCGTRDAK